MSMLRWEALQRRASLGQAITKHVARGKIEIRERMVWVERHGLPGFFLRRFEFPEGGN